MKPYYQDNHNTIYCQDFRENDLPDESVQCVVTSPPYWGLRKYSGEQELVWGDKDCVHQWGEEYLGDTRAYGAGIGQWQDGSAEGGRPHYKVSQGSICSLCGAWKGSYGLEPTPEMYIQHTVEIMREIRRVLRKDGVVFWNIGDSYAGNVSRASNGGRAGYGTPREGVFQRGSDVIKPKDLCLIPFRVAIAAQQNWYECLSCKGKYHGSQWGHVIDKTGRHHFVCPSCLKVRLVRTTEQGWWVRSIIIWSKPNPMPESVTDRPTESHEYILMLTKSKNYYWDADAVRLPFNPATIERAKYDWDMDALTKSQAYVQEGIYGRDAKQLNRALADKINAGLATGRNIRSVWEFPTQPYPEAHFAVFPEKLPEICIKAGTPEVGCCSKCGMPWVRIVETKQYPRHDTEPHDLATDGDGANRGKHARPTETQTIGWKPSCECNADKMPSLVLDPFMGSGTVLWVAKKLNRRAVGYEISEEYCKLAVERCRQQVLL